MSRPIIQKVSLLMSAMMRACLTKQSTYRQQVQKYDLNSIEQKCLLELLYDMESKHV
jgi:hypothetical protein